MGSLINFILFTFAASWTCFLSAVAISNQGMLTEPRLAVVHWLVFAGTLFPAFVALLITARADGMSGTAALLRRLIYWRVAIRWFVFALGYMAAIKLGVALAYRLIAGSWPPYGHQQLGATIAAIIFSMPFQSGEEVGWRGYALPRLAKRLGFARASIALGIVWALWHLPLFFLAVPGNNEFGESFPVWALGVTALSVAMAWLYVHTQGNLLLMMLMHSAVNNIPHFLPAAVTNTKSVFSLHASLVAWLTAGFLWIAASYFLMRMPKAKSQRG